MLPHEAADGEAAMFVRSNRRLRKKWIIGAIELSGRQIRDPVANDGGNIFPHRKESCLDRLAEFRLDLARVLKHVASLDRDMFKLEAPGGYRKGIASMLP